MIYLNPEQPQEVFFLDWTFSITSMNLSSGIINKFYSCSPFEAERDYGNLVDFLYFFDKDRGISGGFFNSSELIIRRIYDN